MEKTKNSYKKFSQLGRNGREPVGEQNIKSGGYGFVVIKCRCSTEFALLLMANSPDADADDDFSELYKEYTGPPRSTSVPAQEKMSTNKRSHAGSDEEDEPRDPNAVPTDFTSREAKVWEAKSKATERNWKKRKEEEMICKICGESGHFTQV